MLHPDESEIINRARQLLYEQALVFFEGLPIGTLAALPQQVRTYESGRLEIKYPNKDLNYTEVFIRDNVPVMIYFLLDGRADIVQNFLNTCLRLQSQKQQTEGVFPTSFYIHYERPIADYGQRSIGRVVSIDATLWWPILAHIYLRYTDNLDWVARPEVQTGLRKFLALLLHPWFREAPTLQVPDGAFMIDRPLDVWGTPLEIQVLLYGALVSTAELLLAGNPQGLSVEDRDRVDRSLKLAVRLRRYLLSHYWIDTRTVQLLRRRPTELYGDTIVNEYNIYAETIPHWLQTWLGEKGGYLIGNIRTGRPDFRFFTLGNCLGSLFDVITYPQQRSLFQLILQNQADLFAQMPLRMCHPPLDQTDWQNKTGFDPKNRPWCYHNGGHWPCLFWFLVAAVMRHSQSSEGLRYSELYLPLQTLIKEAYLLLLRRLPEQNWPEYFDGPTGLWIGQQARTYQTWTVTSLLLCHQLLIAHPGDRPLFDLPKISDLLAQLEAQS